MSLGRKNLSVSLVFIFFGMGIASGRVSAQTTEPILSIEVGTHNAGIMRIAADAGSHILVTGSEDKTVRVWDIDRSGELLQILRPPAANGGQGKINAVALSPDGKTVACGGMTGAPQKQDAWVYLFDRNTGIITRRLGGLPGLVMHLTYTTDGRFMVVATKLGGISLFRLPDYTLVAEDRAYGNFAWWAESNSTGLLLATSCWDGFVRLYDLSTLPEKVESRPYLISPVSKVRPINGTEPWGLAFSPKGQQLAVGLFRVKKVDVFNVSRRTLIYDYSPDTSDLTSDWKNIDLRAVAWSADGRYLYGGGGYNSTGIRLIRKWDGGGRGSFHDLDAGSTNEIFQLLTNENGGVFYGARDGSLGAFNDRDERVVFIPPAMANHVGSQGGFLISEDASSIQFAYELAGKSPAIFSLYERRLTDSLSMLWSGWKAAFTFLRAITDGIGITDWKASFPKLNGKPLPLRQDEPSACLAILPDRSGFLLGTALGLRLFNKDGRFVWTKPLPTPVFVVNTNGQVAVAGLGDGTIRWYRLSDGKEIMAFFPHPDRKRWILWTPSGYYDASPGGENFIGWHVNNGKDDAADFFPISRFRSIYYRPDVIDEVLKTLDESMALARANEASGRGHVSEVSVRDRLPPVVMIVNPPDRAEVFETPVKVNYSVRSSEPLNRLRVLLDGRPVQAKDLDKSVNESGDFVVDIPKQNCEISIIAETNQSVSEPATIKLLWKGVADTEFYAKPKLYMLAVGISNYQDADLHLGLAAKDALDFSAIWQQGQLYSSVEARVLLDDQATKGNILDGLEWIQRQVTQKDVAVIFFAGHGVNDANGLFYFLPVEANLESLKRTGISQADIASTVATIAGKVLVFMDACHSGNLLGKTKQRGLSITSAVVNELASAENGAIVFSSSTGRQYSQENPAWGNGAFTKGLVEGLSGKADYQGTGRITVNMLDLYTSERVKELTNGQQTPSTVKPPNVSDYPIIVK